MGPDDTALLRSWSGVFFINMLFFGCIGRAKTVKSWILDGKNRSNIKKRQYLSRFFAYPLEFGMSVT